MKKLLAFFISIFLTASLFTFFSPAQEANASAADTDLALTLNGTNQVAYGLSNSNIETFTSLTLEAWVNPTSTPTYMGVIGKEIAYTIYSLSGYWYYALANTSGSWSDIGTGVKVVPNEWHHLALTRAAGVNTAYFYIDGQLVYSGAAGSAGTGTIGSSTYALYIGDRASYTNGTVDTNWVFPGKIDEVRIWKSARTQPQIQSDMHNYGPTNDSNLVSYYSFNNSDGTNNSTSGGGPTLSFMNTPTFSDVKEVDTTTTSGYSIIKFPHTYINSSGGWTVPNNVSQIEYLVVGGGGGGSGGSDAPGYCESGGGGGGGGGGVAQATANVTSGATLSMQIGVGGRGGFGGGRNGQGWFGGAGESGTATTFLTTTKNGGGGGLAATTNCKSANGGTSAAGYGPGVKGANNADYGGGGGGDSAVGITKTGGAGTSSNILNLNYGGGGGGGAEAYSSSYRGLGTDGGGNGMDDGTYGLNGIANRGGGGGGGSGAGAGLGGTGGQGSAGVLIIKYKNYFGTSVTISVGAKKTTKSAGASAITATTTSTGTVTFYANGRIINGCKNVVVSGTTATCNWRPMTHGQVTLTATYTSNDPLYSGSAAAPAYVTTVSKRTGAR